MKHVETTKDNVKVYFLDKRNWRTMDLLRTTRDAGEFARTTIYYTRPLIDLMLLDSRHL